MSENVIMDEGASKTSIDAIVDIKIGAFIPDSHNQSITIEDATEIFMIVGKPYNAGGSEYALVRGGEYGDVDLVSMMHWLQDVNPELFGDLLRAALEVANEEELDEALEDAGWHGADANANIVVFVSHSWLLKSITDVEEFEADLEELIGGYLAIGGHDEVSYAVIIVDDRCPNCNGEHPCDCASETSAIPWEVTIGYDYREEIGEETADDFAAIIEKEVIIPVMKKYGLINDGMEYASDDDDDAASDNEAADGSVMPSQK